MNRTSEYFIGDIVLINKQKCHITGSKYHKRHINWYLDLVKLRNGTNYICHEDGWFESVERFIK